MNIDRIGIYFQFKNYEKFNYSLGEKKNIMSRKLEMIFKSLNKIISKYDVKIFRISFQRNKVIFRIANNLNGCLLINDPFYSRYDEPFKYIKDVEFFCNMDLKE